MTDQGPPPPAQKEAGQKGFIARHLLALVILVVAVVFVAENTHKVRIRAIVPWVTVPQWEALAITLVAGMLILSLVKRRRHRH